MAELARITNHSVANAARFERARGVLRGHATLRDVLEWCVAQPDRRDLADVVVQDEFTHDVVLELEPGLFAVHDTT